MSTDFLLSLKETLALFPRNRPDYLTVANSGVADIITGSPGPFPCKLCHIRYSGGVSHWFQLPLQSLSICSFCNTFSLREHPSVVSQYIASECHMKWKHGPFSSLYNIHTIPIGVIPKKHRAGKWYLIVEGSSINDGIDSSLCSMSYIPAQDTIQELTKLGKKALLYSRWGANVWSTFSF